MNNSRLTQKDLETLIDRYFEAETTEIEEVLLRNYLLHGSYLTTPAVRDALAVMSLTAVRARRARRRRHAAWVASIAASVAIVIALAVRLNGIGREDVCEMYIAGVHVPGHEWVIDKIRADLQEVSEASAAGSELVGSQLSEFMDLVTSDSQSHPTTNM